MSRLTRAANIKPGSLTILPNALSKDTLWVVSDVQPDPDSPLEFIISLLDPDDADNHAEMTFFHDTYIPLITCELLAYKLIGLCPETGTIDLLPLGNAVQYGKELKQLRLDLTCEADRNVIWASTNRHSLPVEPYQKCGLVQPFDGSSWSKVKRLCKSKRCGGKDYLSSLPKHLVDRIAAWLNPTDTLALKAASKQLFVTVDWPIHVTVVAWPAVGKVRLLQGSLVVFKRCIGEEEGIEAACDREQKEDEGLGLYGWGFEDLED